MSQAQQYSVGIPYNDTASADSTKDLSDDFEQIQNIVKTWSDNENLDIVVTTGGTGFGVKDITPEAIEPLKTPFAALSRLVSGVRGKTIIITVPGSPKGAKEIWKQVINVLPHAVDLAKGGTGENVHAQLNAQKTNNNPLSGPVTQRQRSITVPVNENLVGMVLAEDVYAKEPVPGYRASIVDGKLDGPRIYPVVGVSIANVSIRCYAAQTRTNHSHYNRWAYTNGATAVVMVERYILVKLKYGQIRDSNRPTLLAIGKITGFEVKDFGIVSDNVQELEND
ncbi:unnamed protein product [Rhizophagus irregularis]|nr:unnamed protein product [Rhizophagus irregularis]